MYKNQSIKKDLIITLSILVALVLITVRTAGFIYVKHHNQEVLDANLVKSAKLIFNLIKHDVFEGQNLEFLSDTRPAFNQKIFHRYEYKLHAQAWEEDKLIYNSDNFLLTEKPSYEGFQDIIINGEKWRGFSLYDEKSRIRILVAEKDFVTSHMIWEMILSFTIPLILSFSLLFGIIIITVNKKLKPLQQLTNEIAKMSADSLQQFQNPKIPIELKPFINSFNSLVERLIESINSERNFTNYAAHELKTPLAAIGIQAHLLINNKNKEKEQKYIQDLLDGINRATHLINQLLTLARLESDNVNIKQEKLDLVELSHLIAKNYLKKAQEKNLAIEFDIMKNTKEFFIYGNITYLEILISNLLDNAIKYSENGKKIKISINQDAKFTNFRIDNFGDEILPAEIEKIFNNFYRINRLDNQNSNVGCGLGLAIAKKITNLHNANIIFKSENNINSVILSFKNL